MAKRKKQLPDKKTKTGFTENTEFGSRDYEAQAQAEAVKDEHKAKRHSPNISRPGEPGYSR